MRATLLRATVRWLILCVVLGGCSSGDEDPLLPPDAPPDVPGCIPNATRAEAQVTVSGSVVDFATRTPIAGAHVDFLTAWDLDDNWPDGCPPLATFTTDGNGRFGPTLVQVGSTLADPITLFLVSGDGLASTASDQRVTCTAGNCGNLSHTIATPSASVADAWRTELATGGMPDAATRGIVLFEFREMGGPSAAGVEPYEGVLVTRALVAGTEVRFLDADRATVAPVSQTTTLASGLAMASWDVTSNVGHISGRRGAEQWADVGVLLPAGWLFLEDKQRSP